MSRRYDANTTAETVVADLAPYIVGRVVLVTGVSPGGLGAFFVEQLARCPAPGLKLLILAGRSLSKIQATADSHKDSGAPTRLLVLDLESVAGAREAAATVNAWDDVPHIDVLVNNAGISAPPFSKTVDGIEHQFAVNHVAPFLFTNLIIAKILKAPGGGRIVSVASDSHRLGWMRWGDINFQDGKLYNKWRAYGQSKTANMLFAVALARRLGSRGLIAVSLNPGAVVTNLANHLDLAEDGDFAEYKRLDQQLGRKAAFAEYRWKTPTRGVATHVYASFEPSLKDHNGAYLQDVHVADPYVEEVMPHAMDSVEAEKLWSLTESLVREKFAY